MIVLDTCDVHFYDWLSQYRKRVKKLKTKELAKEAFNNSFPANKHKVVLVFEHIHGNLRAYVLENENEGHNIETQEGDPDGYRLFYIRMPSDVVEAAQKEQMFGARRVSNI